MITDGRATLSIYSTEMTAVEITTALGIVPSKTYEQGDLTPSGRAGRLLKPQYLTYQQAGWHLDAPDSVDDPDAFRSLRALVRSIERKAEVLRTLRPACDTVIRWYGSSDSSQGGFVMDAELLVGLAALGCDLVGTAYLSSAEPELESDRESQV
ncbi:DUF4279 domain-containing protein [Microbacterium sp. LWH11-1.2]|uniref:DUF4279 domain-containing protein n=1 Tax=Microbacterium sp. LWH11-1.2 TaxID=3135258 RepID=UPI0031397D99